MRSTALLSSLCALLSACSGLSVEVDKPRLEAVKKVAVVVFNVPINVVTNSSGNESGSALGFILSAAQNKSLTNGVAIADDAVAGFIDAVRSGGRFEVLDLAQVSGHAGFASVRDAQGKKTVDTRYSAPKGLVNLKIRTGQSKPEFVVETARALGVDGVFVILCEKMNYRVWSGVDSSGTAKAEGTIGLTLYSADGTPAWQDILSLSTDETAPIITGAVNPSTAKGLHRDIGKVIYRDASQRLAEATKAP